MKCPNCNAATKVTDSRHMDKDVGIKRRRKCGGCGLSFDTLETVMLPSLDSVKTKPKPKPAKKLKVKPKSKRRFVYDDIDNLTDDDLEIALFSGDIYFDE